MSHLGAQQDHKQVFSLSKTEKTNFINKNILIKTW